MGRPGLQNDASKAFTPLVLIQHQGYRNLKQSTAMAKFVEQGHIDKLVTSDNVATPYISS